MPRGDADRIHEHCGDLVQAARDAGEKTVSIHVGDVRDALGLHGKDAAIDICQVLEGNSKFLTNSRVSPKGKIGPNQGVRTVYSFNLLE